MLTIKDIVACSLCNSKNLRVHELKNIRSKNGPVLKENNIFFCTCSDCDGMYLIEECCNNISFYPVSDHIYGYVKEELR